LPGKTKGELSFRSDKRSAISRVVRYTIAGSIGDFERRWDEILGAR
jgi:hypothetical protein